MVTSISAPERILRGLTLGRSVDQVVVTVPASDLISALTAVEEVVASIAVEGVLTLLKVGAIGAEGIATAVQTVVASVTVDIVVARSADQEVPATASRTVVASLAVDGIVAAAPV